MSTLLVLSEAMVGDLRERLSRLAEDAPGGALLSVTLDLGQGDSHWLERQPACHEFCYWARPATGLFRLGLGRAVVCTSAGPARFTALQAAHAGIATDWRHDAGDSLHQPVACMGFAFEENGGGELPNAQLGVAAVLLTTANGRCSATFTTPARDRHTALDHWQKLLKAMPSSPASESAGIPASQLNPSSSLTERAWAARVQRALAAITDNELEKIVLSRSLRLPLPTHLASNTLLSRLLAQHPGATIFAIGNESCVFLGATPEQLAGLTGKSVCVDALAGTAWGNEPLAVEKNAHEQALVVAAIRKALAPLCDELTLPPAPRTLELRHLRHLWTPITGSVRPGIGLFDLISSLHPTPAVGGWPAAAARDWLRQHGEKRPGWYSGGFGWIDRYGNGEVAVALRCGLIRAGHIELPAGAGIVAGSCAENEFRETEAKLATMLDALRAGNNTADAISIRTGTH